MMKKLIPILALAFVAIGCEEEEPPPETPPQIEGATITCADQDGQDYQVVQEVAVTITDPERDLVESSIEGFVNGLEMEGLEDPDADQAYTWSPPSAWNPPMICRGDFTILVRASDATGKSAEETLIVSK